MKQITLVLVAVAICLLVYSCASKCVIVPPPGGLSYDQTLEKDQQGATK